ncbi:hypothetical protein [Microcoleus vaginatus]|uniref:hypothetical protein n=1 Tax=Microcoleus vaginatus TaxID=119532 RepID=UPI001F61E1A1
MPVPQENSLFVEQASCLFLRPVPQENSLFVEQASCLFLRMVQDVSLIRDLSLPNSRLSKQPGS